MNEPAPTADWSPADEERLVRQAQEHSPEAWTLIYERHFPRIYNYVYYRTRSRETAEDLAAQVFVEALAGIGRYRYSGRPLLAWLYRIAHNITVDHLRRNSRDPTRGTMPEDVGGGDDTETLAGRADVLAAVSRLKPEQQQVILLRFVEGLTSSQVATVIGKSESAVKALQVRGLQTLRREMSDSRNATLRGRDEPA